MISRKLFLLCLIFVQITSSFGGCPFAHKAPNLEATLNFTCHIPPENCNNVSNEYRTYNGSCNNEENIGLGMPDSPYARFLTPNYADGVSAVPKAKSGNELPNARAISLALFLNNTKTDSTLTLLCMQFGQFLSHDMSEVKNTSRTAIVDCCSATGRSSDPRCFPIDVPANDFLYGPAGVTCLNFSRTITDKDLNCTGRGSFAEQLNEVNSWIDLSVVYGNNDATVTSLRSLNGGLMESEVRQSQEWPPHNPNAIGVCRNSDASEPCYVGGDNRLNQHAQLGILQILFLREHNRLAKALAANHNSWSDEKLFQEARKINIAQFQAITYNEWLPNILGQKIVTNSNISFPNAKWFINDYNSAVSPLVLNEHAQAAFRFFHSTIAGQLNLYTEDRVVNGSLRLTDWVARPGVILEQGSNFDSLLRGLVFQPEREAGEFVTDEITQFWFRFQTETWGQDLRANDVQRGRDNGLGTYNDARVKCGLPRATTFTDFSDVMTDENANKLASLYEVPDDVDLTVGTAMESLQTGALTGPTTLCILRKQFLNSRQADRFFFERSGITGFSLKQLNQIRRITFARLLCDNTLTIKQIQPNAFKQVSSTNALVDCSAIPSVNLKLW